MLVKNKIDVRLFLSSLASIGQAYLMNRQLLEIEPALCQFWWVLVVEASARHWLVRGLDPALRPLFVYGDHEL